MKKKIFGILIMMLLMGTTITMTQATENDESTILFEQLPLEENDPETFHMTSDIFEAENFNIVAFDDFWDITRPICSIGWWGLPTLWEDGWTDPCDPIDMIFDIKFYEDDDGLPGSEICAYNSVTPEITETDMIYEGWNTAFPEINSPLYYFEISKLYPICDIINGWISIQAVDNDNCKFIWVGTNTGNLNSIQYNNEEYFDSQTSDRALVFKTTKIEMITFEGPSKGSISKEHTYTISTVDSAGYDIYYYIDWGDGTIDDWFGTYESGEEITVSHTWSKEGDYTIQAKAKNSLEMETDYMTLEVTMPKTIDHPFLTFLENHPNLFPLLQWLLEIY